jgi:hypothetical protein
MKGSIVLILVFTAFFGAVAFVNINPAGVPICCFIVGLGVGICVGLLASNKK